MKKLCILLLAVLLNLLIQAQEYKKNQISDNLDLIKISDNVFMHVSYKNISQIGLYPANGLIYINKGKTFLFDTPWTDSLTMSLISWLKDSMKSDVAGFIPNHWHEDCMGGLSYLQHVGIKSYAHQKTIDIAKSKKLPTPEKGFKDSLILNLGEKEIKCYYFGPAHTSDNIVVWIPDEKILFAGCMVKSMHSKDLGNTADADLGSYPIVIEQLIKKFPTVKIVIPGHGSLGGIELITHTKSLTKNK